MKPPPSTPPRALTWPEARRWALRAASLPLGLLTAAIVAFLVRGAARQRAVVRLEARGGFVVATDTPAWLGHLMGKDARSCGGWVEPPPSWPVLFLNEQYALHHGCGVMLEERAGDEALALLPDLPCLTELQAPNAALSDGGLRHLRPLVELELLNLHGTPISGAGLVHVRGFRSLSRLVLANTRVDDAGLAQLDELPALAWLDLAGTRITGAALGHLARFPALRSLDLGGTGVDDAGLRRLAGLHLTRLVLRDAPITEAGMAILAEMHELEEVDVCGTRAAREAGEAGEAAVGVGHARVVGCPVTGVTGR
jgi:hypothetical protein